MERLSLPEKLGFITSPKAQELKEPVARPKIEPVSQTFDLFRPVYFCNNSVYNCQFLEVFAYFIAPLSYIELGNVSSQNLDIPQFCRCDLFAKIKILASQLVKGSRLLHLAIFHKSNLFKVFHSSKLKLLVLLKNFI